MRRRVARILYFVILVVGMLLMALFASLQMPTISYIAMAATFAGMIYCIYQLRCPYCGRWPRKGDLFAAYCAGCGEKLDD